MPLTKDFLKLEKRIEREYLGKPVPNRFLKTYGKKYNKKDIRPLTYAIAKRRGIKIDKIKFNDVKGGELNE